MSYTSVITKNKNIITTAQHINIQTGITKLIFKPNMKFFHQNI